MKRILLISDTHGNLNLLESLIKETEVDAVIHAGDFGFYDTESINRLQIRELRLHIIYSPYRQKNSVTKETSRQSLTEIIEKHNLRCSNTTDGYAILKVDSDKFALETFSKGIEVKSIK